jgi:hypothetical protein
MGKGSVAVKQRDSMKTHSLPVSELDRLSGTGLNLQGSTIKIKPEDDLKVTSSESSYARQACRLCGASARYTWQQQEKLQSSQ